MDKAEEYQRAETLSDADLIKHGREIYRHHDRQGEHFKAAIIQEMWLRMRQAQAKLEILDQNEDL